MENQPPGHPQHGMSDQGSRPFTSLLLPAAATYTAANAASTLQAADGSGICPIDDGYIWMKYGQQTIPGWESPTIYFVCNQANCGVKKSVALTVGGQVVETVFSGSHNHPRPSIWPRAGPAGYVPPDSQGYVAPQAYAAGTSMPMAGERGEQLPSSRGTEEDDDGADGDLAGDACATERLAAAPAQRITAQTGRGTSRRKKRRRSTSLVWEEFTHVSGGKKAECIHCKKCLSGKSSGGTSHLGRHLDICPARPATGTVQQQQPSPQLDPSLKKNWKFDQDKSLEFLTKAIVSNFCSFSLADSKNFRHFFSGICPGYDLVSQSAIREKLLSIFQNEKLKLKEEIALAPGGVFLTLAKWNLKEICFACVTAQFVDKEWNITRKSIRCRLGGVSHDLDDEYISLFPDYKSYADWTVWNEDATLNADAKGILKDVILDWGLEGKLLGILLPEALGHTDLCGSLKNVAEQNYLVVKGEVLSLPCIIESLHDLISYYAPFVRCKCRYWFRYMTCTPLRTRKYREIVSQLQINRPSFGSQIWYLTFYLLEATLQFNKVFPNPEFMDLSDFPPKPSHEELAKIESFCSLGRLIYDAIKVVSNPCTATLNSHFHPIWSLKIALLDLPRMANIDEIYDPNKAVQEIFDQLWKKWYLWLSLAVVVDPRYKTRFLECSFQKAIGSDAKRYMLEVRGKIYELFFRYSFHADQQSGDRLNNESNNDLQLESHGQGSVPLHETSRNYSEQSANEKLGELHRYLEADLMPENVPFDILKWWKDNASTYPILARMACDILAIPGCVVSAESAFDKTDKRVSLFSRELSPETVEALICTQDWIKSSEMNNEVDRNRNVPA